MSLRIAAVNICSHRRYRMTHKRSKCDNDAIQFPAIKFHYLGKLDKRCSEFTSCETNRFYLHLGRYKLVTDEVVQERNSSLLVCSQCGVDWHCFTNSIFCVAD